MPKNLKKLPIILVDDEPESLSLLKSILRSTGYENVVTFETSLDALQYCDQMDVAVAVLDLRMPGMSGLTLLEHISRKKPRVPAIIVTAENQIETAIECMRTGAVDYLVKPISIPRFMTAITSALEMHSLDEEISASATEDKPHVPYLSSIITNNREMLSLFRYLEIVAKSLQPILITGETGVGKELFAQAVHPMSKRSGMFVSVNIAGLDDLMFSDTLFGHRKGAYTGAIQDREGLVKKAANGTLFLDEIGDLNELSQIKLLRLIQENEYYPLGSDTQLPSYARLVLATNQNLKQRMSEGKFRKDLYFRLCTHQISVPPLRNRRDDIPVLLEHFIRETVNSLGKQPVSFRKELIDLLNSYDFPGNVRELQAMVSDVVARSTSSYITVDQFRNLLDRERDFDEGSSDEVTATNCEALHTLTFSSFPTLKQVESTLISRALQIANNNQGVAAQMLGITRQALNNRLRRAKGRG